MWTCPAWVSSSDPKDMYVGLIGALGTDYQAAVTTETGSSPPAESRIMDGRIGSHVVKSDHTGRQSS